MKEPTVKKKVLGLEPFSFDYCGTIKLVSADHIQTPFVEVLDGRNSTVSGYPMNLDELGKFLFLSNRTKRTELSTDGHVLQWKNFATPGALSSVSTLLVPPTRECIYHYIGARHQLKQISNSLEVAVLLNSACSEVIAEIDHCSWLIWLVCDETLLDSKYENYHSLAFRESGGISATHALVAHALECGYRQLGINGYSLASSLSDQRKLFGVGLATLGKLP